MEFLRRQNKEKIYEFSDKRSLETAGNKKARMGILESVETGTEA
jgi:hypothetical protein